MSIGNLPFESSSSGVGAGNSERSAQDGAHRTTCFGSQGRVRGVVADVAESLCSMPLTALVTRRLSLSLEVSFRFDLISN